MTMNTIWGIKLESVIDVVAGRLISFGMKIKMMISMIGMATPMMEYTSGLDELLQAKHHTTLNTIAIIMINVPTPIPKIRPELFWQFAHVSKNEIDINKRLLNFYIFFRSTFN